VGQAGCAAAFWDSSRPFGSSRAVIWRARCRCAFRIAVGFGMITYDEDVFGSGHSQPRKRIFRARWAQAQEPIVRTRQPLLPPGVRSRAALGLTAAAAARPIRLQVCGDCGASSIRRGMVSSCLTGTLRWREQSGRRVDRGDDRASQQRFVLPRARAVAARSGAARRGPTAVVHLHGGCPRSGPACASAPGSTSPVRVSLASH